MESAREAHVQCESRWLYVFVLACLTSTVTGVVDVTIVSKYQFFDESAVTWLYCYYTGSLYRQNGYQFGVEVDTGSGTGFLSWRSTARVTGSYSVRMWQDAGNARVGVFSCLVRTPDSSQTEKAITFKIKSQADVWPVTFTVTANTGDRVTLQMVQKSSRTGTPEWRKGGVGGTVLTGQNGLSLTIASVQSSDEGIYECYYQGDTDRRQGIMRLIVRGCAENKWGPSCTGDCPVCYNGGVCDDNTGGCVCPPGFNGQNCESACTNGMIGTSCTRECDGGNCTGQLLCVMDPYGCSCAPGLMGIECNTVCPDGLYGAGCTQTCHCADGPAACDKKTGTCIGGCLDFWVGDSCQMRTATVSYEALFVKEEGRFFGDSPDNITAYSGIDADECARRCLQGHGSYDGVIPTCLSFNHRPAESLEGGSARCWLRSSNKDTAASPGPEWDSWPDRNYYQRKHILAPQDCTEVFALGIQYSHVYTIGHPQPFQAYCDMDTDGGGWTVIQRRQDGSVPFDKTWTEYEQGFGNPSGEYWLGLGNINSLTTQKQNKLYVYLEDWELNSRFAQYSTFSVGDTGSKYEATIDGYSGDASGDSLDPSTTRHSINNRQFSTTDQDNDGTSTDCVGTFGQGGWWYPQSCGYTLLNGQYLTGCSVPSASCSFADGIVWYTWLGYRYSLKKTVMMIRPTDFPASSFQPCENGGTLTSGPEDSGLYICACADGWYGAFCDQECSGTYGPDCNTTCGHCYGSQTCDRFIGTCPTGGSHVCAAGYNGDNCDQECSGTYGPDCLTACGHCYLGRQTCDRFTGTCPTGESHVCAVGYNGTKCDQECSGTYGLDCGIPCGHCYGSQTCDRFVGTCPTGGFHVCVAGYNGTKCDQECSGTYGPDCDTTCRHCYGNQTCDRSIGTCPTGGAFVCAAGYNGDKCDHDCPDGLYGADCTQTCHCADGPAACDKKTGACTGGCHDLWTGDSCQIRTATVSYEGLFIKEKGRFFGDSPDHITAYSNIDAEECARRCLQGHGSYDGVNPTCLSFNHRPAESPEGGSARCWLLSSDKDTAASPGSEWGSWPQRNYYQRKNILAPQDCTEVFTLGIQHSHVYTVGHPQPFQAYCDMDTDGGGWTILQRRQDGSVSFDKTWTEYEQGFGNPSGEYWLGLDNVHSLTTQKQNELYVYLEDWETNSRFARYSTFSVGDAGSKYTATVDGYSGDATDSLDPSTTRHSINNRQFSTTDQDNDPHADNCAILYGQGGWWYPPSCGYSMLNGQYLTGCSVPAPPSCTSANGIVWYTWRGYRYSLKKTVMMIRPTDFPASSFRPCQNGGTLTSGPPDSGLYICACTEGWYGTYCEQACGHCYLNQTCDSLDGACLTGGDHLCTAGYNGTKCDQECSGAYGPDCGTACGHCYVGPICNRFTGRCPTGGSHVCAAGYYGDNCDQKRPEDVTVTVTAVNSTALYVTWAVGETGNLDIIDSQVRYKESDTEDWGDWASTGASDVNGEVYIYGLQPAVEYDAQVRANNSLGWSTPGNGTGTTDDALPSPPRTLQATPTSHNYVHLTWEPPIKPNGQILNYTVQYGPSESCSEAEFPHQITTPDGSTTTVIGALVPSTNYTFRVWGTTSAGGGDFSDCNVTRTLEYYPTVPVLQTFADQHDCNCQTPNIPRPVQLRVAWQRPDHIHGQLQAYRISLYNSTGGEPFYQENMTSGLQQENLAAVITSSHLQPAKNYSVTVSAINTFYHGNESLLHMTRTSDGCPNAPTVTRMANSECGVTWTGPTETRGKLTGYNITYTDTPRLNPDEYEQSISYDTLGADQQQWSKSLDELPANSLVRVTVRALTCAEGDKGQEFTCEVSRVEPPTPSVPPNINLKASATSFPMVLPKVSERNGPLRCCQVIVIRMGKAESLADLESRVGEPDVILTNEAPDEGKTEPYVALSLSGQQYRNTDVVQIGDGGPCGHEWCCGRSELVVSSLANESGNKKLQPGEKYTAAVRCYVDSGARRRKRNTEKLFMTSGYIEPVITIVNQDQPVSIPAIVGSSVAALLVVVLVAAGIAYYRKRNAKDDQDPTGPQIDLKIIKEDKPSIKESAENPTVFDEDISPYETTVYSIADLVTIHDVVEFLRAKGFGEYAAAFRRHKVDGEGAMSLTSDMLAELVPEIGPRAKLQKALHDLRENQDSAESSKPVHPDWEIPRSSLKLGKILGKGQFGEVRMGELRKRGVTQTVAVKTLKASAEERDKQDLVGELDILVTVGRHDNIISLVGACTVEGPLTLVVEYAPNGCLKDWLRNNRPKELNQTDHNNIAASGNLLPMEQLIMFGVDIANGMSHLAAMQCVHRDLAARNVLLGKDLTAKICDFGLSRDIYEESEYVKSTKSQLPIRWVAYESLFYQVYTSQSDVWSFGILLWEIMTMGKQPYGRMTGKELMKLLPGGYRLEKPALCPQDVYEVMKSCWETLPENRPTFPELKATLDRIIQDYKTYASLLK